MAIDYTNINKGGISLGTNFELISDKPLDSRLTVPNYNGLNELIINNAAYEGMIVYDEETKKYYRAQACENIINGNTYNLKFVHESRRLNSVCKWYVT